MNSTRMLRIAAIIASTFFFAHSIAQASENRQEFKRIDLVGSPNMEVISSISEFKPGEILGRHFHHGVESGYFIQGGMIQAFGEEPISIPTGAPIMNERGAHHGGFKVVGDKTLKIYTVHIVEKGKPLYDWVEK